ncbi:uncharacterized protein [Dermacentor andersoni]|uniref:uncharacterized protein isoform X1 n=1 Tax=Dermacentor andersoni TaxID=34620 RepID=UPI003B3A685D
MTSNPHSRALFVKADGGPMYFSMAPCSERKEIRELIENGGGVLLQPHKNPDAVRLVPTCITTTEGPDDAFSATYIRACISSNKLFPLKEFKIPRASAAETDDDGDCKEHKLRSVRSRREYTLGEEIAMAKYIAKKPRVCVRGNEVYKEMAAACAVPGAHPWQSLKQHYLKRILPWKHLYESPDASKILGKRHAHEAQEARDTSPSATSECGSVIVEDSSSDDEQLPKPRGATDGRVENSWDPETEVVAETESPGASSYSKDSNTPAVRKHSSRRLKMKRKKLLLSTEFLSGSCKESSSESSPRHKSNIAARGKNSHDDGIADSSQKADEVPEKSAMPTPAIVQSKMFPGKTSSIQTQSQPGKQDDGVGISDSQTAAVAETASRKKHVLRSSPRKSKNAKQQETPADERTHVHSLPHSDLSEGLCVLESVGMQQTTQSSPQKNVDTAASQKHTSGLPNPSLLSQSHDCTASGVTEGQVSHASKLRSFRLPIRKQGSTKSHANLSTRFNTQSTFESTHDDTATKDKFPHKAFSKQRPLRSPRSKRLNTARQIDLDGQLDELPNSESTDGIVTTKAFRSSPESVYNTAESESTSHGTDCIGKDDKNVPSAQKQQAKPDSTAMKTHRKALRVPALRRSDKTLPSSSENARLSSTRRAAGCKKEPKSTPRIGSGTSGFDSADDALLARVAEQASALHGSSEVSSEEQDDATTITLSSSSRHSDEDSTLDDEVENVQRELSRLLAALEEGKGRPPHTTCPPRCTCPLTSWYAQSARAAVSLSAFLAFHDAPLPDQPGGVTDPVVAMALEWMLRHLEQGANEGDRSASQ